MDTVKDAAAAIKAYNGSSVPLSYLGAIIKVKHQTLAAKIRRREFPAWYDGHKYLVNKRTAYGLARKNKSRIEGWPRGRDIAKKYNINHMTVTNICRRAGLVTSLDFFDQIRLSFTASDYFENLFESYAPVNGWNRQGKVARENGLDVRTVDYLCRRDRLETALDFQGRRRLSPAAEQHIKSIAPVYSSRNTVYFDNKKYYSLVKTARDAAALLAKRGTKEFRKQFERCYKTFYFWLHTDGIPYRIFDGNTKLFVPKPVYEKFTDRLRICDAVKYAGVSNVTIFNWIKREIVVPEKTPGGKKTILSRKKFRDALTEITQTEMARKHLHKLRINKQTTNTTLNFLECVYDVRSNYWRVLIMVLRRLERGYRFLRKPNLQIDEYISQKTGWPLSRIHATRQISRIRSQGYADISHSQSKEDGDPFIRIFGCSREINPVDDVHNIILSEDIDMELSRLLDPGEVDLVKQRFGFDGPVNSIDEIAAKMNTQPDSIEEAFSQISGKLGPLNRFYDQSLIT